MEPAFVEVLDVEELPLLWLRLVEDVLQTGVSVIKLYFFVTDEEAKLAKVFVSIKPLQPGLISASKT